MVANVVALSESKREIQHLNQILSAQKQAFRENPMPNLSERLTNLKRLKAMVLKYETEICDAINADFSSRSKDETLIAEIMSVVSSINYCMKNLKKWMKPEKRHVNILFQPASAKVVYQPKGVVGIVVPWNYPIFLALGPLCFALAAGNRAMVKMSEYTPRTSALLDKIISETFDETLVSVITGEADVAQEFTKKPFDHILFTGSTLVGSHVMRAAAENLTPVTLELGGKSPAIIAPDVPMHDAVDRICFGKSFNAGQTCVAPDYVLCPSDKVNEFVDYYKETFARLYPSIKDNHDYTAIVDERQYQRLKSWIEDARNKGAEVIEINPANEDLSSGTRKLPLHIVLNPTPDMTIMQEEIFGPILPVMTYHSMNEAINFVNDRPRPLALYYFGYNVEEQEHVLAKTHAGGVCLNDAIMHVALDDLPFGGIGPSGMGAYHGHEGFLTFSHAKSVLSKPRLNSGKLAYAPYGKMIHKMIYKFFIR
ncbi:coniferyl aldehyde dehydrogenase [Litoribrevibacter albus]|uniref:Aldehyde dehydrogenase n=1 Tax=Litoribrevibacter albus TaxID=1473156 RepID=A0AA37SBS1_9GAMM|nr:coniferyl aldehyde dehydrogenase [Litoribrevibacter albus]GLQ33045.1 putative coniferyl aldehyde dehydrogenase [Litoribrevibacter albus]